MENKKITISDIAEELGVSKTTVSRAISGKGRIGEETRRRVMEYIQAHNYRPNLIAKSLAQSKTFNIGVVMPNEYNLMDLPFFQRCLIGITQVACGHDYDVLVSMITENDISQLERIIIDNKVDGVILTRSLVDDKAVAYLKEKGVPFVVIGATSDLEVTQIDNDHYNACKELTTALLGKGYEKLALLGGNANSFVSEKRYMGFVNAHNEKNIPLHNKIMFTEITGPEQLEEAVEKIIDHGADCIVAMDDYLCNLAINVLRKKQIQVPDEYRVASFYDSRLMENNIPSITSIQFDVKELGMKTCKLLLHMLEGEEVPKKTRLGYEISLRESTKQWF